MVKAVLLDIDGTLVDSNMLHAESWSVALHHFGYDVSPGQLVRQIGKGGDEILPLYIRNDEERERLSADINAYRSNLLWNEYMPRIQPFPKTRELIQRFGDAGIRTVMASSASAPELERLKKLANIADLIEKDTSSSDAKQAKPHPDIFEAAMRKMGLQPGECVALGDTPYDIEASGKAGVRCVAVTTGGWTTVELKNAGAVEVYRDVADLLDRFDDSVFARNGAGGAGEDQP